MDVRAEYVFELMNYVPDTKEYKSPHDILAWKTLVALVSKAELRYKQGKRYQTQEQKDRDVYPE